MLRDGSVEAIEGGEAWTAGKRHSWREVDRALRAIAVRRGKLDAEEARWLREAERLEIWQEVGCVSLLEYIERVLGYGPRAAQERMRVAFALEEMPAFEVALEQGMPFSASCRASRRRRPCRRGSRMRAARPRTRSSSASPAAREGTGRAIHRGPS